MSKLIIPIAAAVVGLACAIGPAPQADAQGIHFHTRGLHIDVGHPHRHRSHPRSHYYRGDWGGRYHSGFYGRGHYHFYPPTVVRHYDHYHVIPGHYDYHRGGRRW